MKQFTVSTAFICTFLLALFGISASAQTVSLNDGSILQSNTNRSGVNIGAIDYWDNGQILKNLIGSSNPGMEPLQNRQIWALQVPGTTSSFTVPDIFDTVPANYFAGGTFTVVESQSGGAELGCTGTISANTGPDYPVASVVTWISPVFTVSTPCAAPFNIGDIILVSKTTFPTPESWWETGGLGGTSGSVSGGAQLLSDTTDLCATCGTQALDMKATTAGSVANAAWYFDSESNTNIFVLMNGTYQLSFWAKAASGNPTLLIGAVRGSAGGFNCGTTTPKLTTSWALYTWNCTANETAGGTTPTAAQVTFKVTGGEMYLDNVSFMKTSGDQNNTTVLRDEVIQTLQKYYGTNNASNPGTLRYWVNQNAETITNWTQPDYAHMPTGGGAGYFVSPGGAGSTMLSLEDYLLICQYINAVPYLEIPVTLTATDAQNLVEFLASPSSTTFGARRAALGQSEPWTSVFSTIHLSFCNECWNSSSFSGQNLPYRGTTPTLELYYDYSIRARDIFSAMRADSYYPATGLELVMNAQTAQNYSMDTAIARAHPDAIEIEDYTYGYVSSYSTDAALWQPAMVDPWEKVTNPTDIRNFYQSLHDYQSNKNCGANANAACKVNIYEWGQGTIGGGIDQTHLDYINAGAGEGVVMALQPLLNMQYYGIQAQSFFSLAEFGNAALNGLTSKLWGNVIDMGGATNSVRPEFLGVSLINDSIIGPMYACPITNNATYNFPGSPNGEVPIPAMANVPYVYSFCFENGSQRSLVLINTDLSNTHTLNFAGSNPPSGAVTQRQYAPADLDEMNEAPTGSMTNHTPSTVAIETSSLSSPSSITLPPFSVTALDYTAATAEAAATPTFSPAAGTYAGTQTVSLLDSTSGVTVYYTLDGSTPTTSSAVYSGPLTVSQGETIQALAVASGYTNSPIGSATYTIYPLIPTPTITPATGTFPTAQTVTINEAQAGTTIYYTTNGTAPTTSSTVYTGPFTVSTNQTIEAIAAEQYYTNSAAASVVITIAPPLTSPVFSEAGGTFTSPQSVTITDASSSASIYYTLDGSTPTTSSTMGGGPIWIANNTTVTAMAVQKGFSNSPVSTSTYMIARILPIPTFSLAGGNAAYNGPQTVTISETQAGASVYYTTNGATPTASSTLYTGPITVSSTETVNAIAIETNYTNSAVATTLYTIKGSTATAAAPVFSLAAGTYASAQTVSVADSTAGATIYYTINGTTPTTSSTVYSGPIAVSATETLEAIAVLKGYNNSSVASAAYSIVASLSAPSFSLPSGTYAAAQTVTIIAPSTSSSSVKTAATKSTAADSTATATIYYTTDGSMPTTASSVYSGPITVSATETLRAIAVATGYANSAPATATYTISTTLGAPMFSVPAGTYSTTQTVAISDLTAGVTIYYTTNGATPTTGSAVYGGPITVSATETLQAIAVETGYTTSQVASAAYTISSRLPGPVFSVAAGTYSSAQTVKIVDAVAAATIYYTTDGTTPTTASNVYAGPITVSSTETLKAVVAEAGYATSPTAVAAYTITSSSTTTAPIFSVAAGTYTGPQSVTITDASSSAVIYYTLDGSTPTTASTSGGGPLWISNNTTVNAIAVQKGYASSPMVTAVYKIARILPTPVFSLAAGTAAYYGPQTVHISEATAGTTIYYTTNGTTPTTASNVYNGSITVSSTETIEAIAVLTNYTNSAVATALYTIAPSVPTPAFSVAAGTYTTAQKVTISESLAGSKVYYTTNGTTPTAASTLYTGAITVSASETLQAIAIKGGYTNSTVADAAYAINAVTAATPIFSLTGGSYSGAQSVKISDATAGSTIYYTANGTTPTAASTKYTGAITVGATETVEAIAVATGYTNSNVATAAYTITSTGAALAAPVFSVPGGAYVSARTVSITDATSGASIYYTTNGATPTTSGTKYTGPITISSSETLKAIAAKTGNTASPVTTASYTIAETLPEPAFSKAAGAYPSAESITLSDSHSGATICFTLDGSTPTAKSTHYTTAISVTKTETLKAIAILTGYNNSPIATAAYTIETTLPTPSVSIAAGTYGEAVTVTLKDADASAKIFYTTNGTIPTTSSLKYTAPIKVTVSETIKAIAAAAGFNSSTPLSAAYKIESPAAVPTTSVAVGSYSTAQKVTLKDATAGANIYYTTNGTTPTAASTRYEAPISVTISETIKAIAVVSGHANSPVLSAAYKIQAAAPTASVKVGTYSSSQKVALNDSTPGAIIYYTLNGTTPTTASTRYTAPIVISKSETIKAIAVATNHDSSPVASVEYTIEAAAAEPTASVAVGTYASEQKVTLKDATAGAVIYYTINGTTPTTASTKYTEPIVVSKTETIKAIAVVTGHANSEVATAAYTIETAAAAPTASVAVGTYTSEQKVTLKDATAGAVIYYTVNGATPTTGSTKYTAPIEVAKTETIKAIAVVSGHATSPIATAAYTIK